MINFDQKRLTSKHTNTHTHIPIGALQNRTLGQVSTRT